MLLQINGIGNQKISYKDHAEIEFDTLDTLSGIIKKCINKMEL